MARAVLLYDADCKLCRFAAHVVATLDRRRSLALLGLGDAAADPMLEDVSEEERNSSLRLVLPDGRMISAGAAALGVLERLPATRPLARAAAALHVRAGGRSALLLGRPQPGPAGPARARRLRPATLPLGPEVDAAVGREAVDLRELAGREVELRQRADIVLELGDARGANEG